MIKFYIPSFFEEAKLNLYLIDLIHNQPFYFRDDIRIGAVYGTLPGAIWNGGRPRPAGYPPEEEWEYFQNLIWEYNSRGIPIRFTWTNLLITEEHLEDEMCNRIMKMAHNGRNEVLVANSTLEKYLREKYPKYKYIASITKCVKDENDFATMTTQNDYYMTVLDWRNNRNYDYLNSFSEDIKKKIEILVNLRCFEDCPNIQAHYTIMSKLQLENRHANQNDPFFGCKASYGDIYDMLKVKPLMIKADEIYDFYNKDLGYINFKLEGRDMKTPELIENLVYYMVKPEYINKIRLMLLKYVW